MESRFLHRSTSQHILLLLKLFSESIKTFPISRSDKIIVAVSGGPDSVCLLHLFRKINLQSKWAANRLHVAHLNHAFRPEADDEAEFVSKLCQWWKIPCTITKRPVLELCKDKRLSRQEKARKVRYAFLRQVAIANDARFIALGHTADDQVETTLINLLRGAGTEGFSGIPSSRDEDELVFIRPMLSITRSQILEELKEAQISFVEDRSNYDKRYLRNRVRHELLPLLQTYNPNIKKTLIREANLLKEDSGFLKQYVTDLLPKLILHMTKDQVCFDLPLFCTLHLSIQRRLIRWGIGHLHRELKDIGFEHIHQILTRIFEGNKIRSVSLPRGLWVKKTHSSLILQAASSPLKRFPVPSLPFEISKRFLERLTTEDTVMDIPQWGIRLFMSIKDRDQFDASEKSSLIGHLFKPIPTFPPLEGEGCKEASSLEGEDKANVPPSEGEEKVNVPPSEGEEKVNVPPLQGGARGGWGLDSVYFDNLCPDPEEGRKRNCFVFLDFDTIPLPLTIRGRKTGDRFMPFGMKGGQKKLQDFFVDSKVPKEMRDQVPLLVCPTGIVWVIGYRINECHRVTEKTKTVLSLQVERVGEVGA